MAKRFSEQPTLYTRALQIWQILITKATNRQTLTYTDLAKLMGLTSTLAPLNLRYYLDQVMTYCQANGVPELTVLVVNKATGRPGSGLSSMGDFDKEREKVFTYDWFGIFPPTTGELEQAHKKSVSATS